MKKNSSRPYATAAVVGTLTAALLGAALLPVTAAAAPQYRSSVRVLAGNEIDTSRFRLDDYITPDFNFDGSPASLSGSVQIGGLDSEDNEANMTLTYDGAAEASFSGLRARASSSLANAFYNPDNTPFVPSDSGQTNPEGTPTQIAVSAEARFSDTLSVLGASGLSSIALGLSVDGSAQGKFSGDNYVGGANTNVVLFGDVFENLLVTPLTAQETFYDLALTTGPIPVSNGSANVGLSLSTRVSYSLDWAKFDPSLTLEDLYEGFADFYNTLTIEEIIGLDADGNQVALESVTGSDGSAFELAQVQPSDPGTVPAPSPLLLLGAGVGALALRHRR